MHTVAGRYIKSAQLLFGILAILIISASRVYCQSNETIIQWVAAQMAIAKAYTVPQIQFIDKQELNRIFSAGSQRYMARWTSEHGSSEANEIIGVYLDKAVGLFDPKSRIIYVGSFLPSCQRDAVLAHEITHYFQYIFGGAIVEEGFAAELMLMEREIEASTIEQRFEKQFCGNPGLASHP
jgi:hypothetical protein